MSLFSCQPDAVELLAIQVPVVVKEKQDASDKSRALRLFGHVWPMTIR